MPTKSQSSVPKPRGVQAPAPKGLKSVEQVRAELDRLGMTVSEWARRHDINRWTVFEVLHGRNKGRWGEAHRAAVLLGLKDGELPAVKGLATPRTTKRKAA